MAWNKPVEKDGKNALGSQRRSRHPHSVVRIVIAGVIFASIGIAVFFHFGADKAKTVQDKKVRSLIKEVQPAIAKTNVVEKTAPKPIDPNARPTKVGEEVNGYVLLPSGRMHYREGVITNSIAMRPKGRWEIFDRACNNEIASYLMLPPGGMIIGPLNHNGRFTKDFVESLKEPIIVSHDDSPEVQQLKRDVIAARQELKDAMDRGEDIEKIMSDTRKELQRMMQVKMEMRKLFFEEKKECKTEQDVEDLFNACNKMLEGKGIAPLKYGPITRRTLARQKEQMSTPKQQ